MSITSRLRSIFRSKTSQVLDRIEDPRDALDDSYEQQLKMLQQVRVGLAEVVTAKKRIELQGQEMGARYRKLADQAQEAVNQGRDDIARTALQRRIQLESQVATLRDQHDALAQQQNQLQDNERRLAERVAAFRTEKETIKATYTASEAQVKANEAAAGISSGLGDIGSTLERARDRAAEMQARASATDELLASGALQDLTAGPDADLDRQLRDALGSADIDRQLEAMKNPAAVAAAKTTAVGVEPSPTPPPDEWLSIGRDATA